MFQASTKRSCGSVGATVGEGVATAAVGETPAEALAEAEGLLDASEQAANVESKITPANTRAVTRISSLPPLPLFARFSSESFYATNSSNLMSRRLGLEPAVSLRGGAQCFDRARQMIEIWHCPPRHARGFARQ
jgi:hypothetical protein